MRCRRRRGRMGWRCAGRVGGVGCAVVRAGGGVVVGVVGGVVCASMVLMWWRRGREIGNQRVYGRVGMCPACGYALAEGAGADGMAVCSECGGAWRRDGA